MSRYIAIIAVLVLIGACRSIPIEDRAPMRQQINDNADETIEKLIAKKPELQEQFDTSAGYFAGRISGVKAPVLGFGSGIGVLYDKDNSTRTYMDINRFDLGLGLATGTYRLLALFEGEEDLEKFREGKWTKGISVESAAGETVLSAASPIDDDLSVFVLPESGAGLMGTARIVKLTVNEDLTDTGISEVNIPNKGFKRSDRQGEDAPRKWDRKLPFFAQKVVDKGYDLPLPYGIGLTFVHVDQEMLLENLEVGINGRDKEPFEFVSFDNASARSKSAQIKLDTWLFPFMNVYALLGWIDGEAPLDVVLDGNGMLDKLDINCSGFPPNPLCGALQDKTITLPLEPDFSGMTYGVGTVFAGGWNNWFVAIPISFTYADMEGTETEGIAINATPRFGRVFNLGKWGNIALYGGGTYLKTDLTVTGQVSTPDNRIVIDYTLEQQNSDNWNLVTGGNWDINKRWSLMAEYNGYIGSRDAVIISVVSRF